MRKYIVLALALLILLGCENSKKKKQDESKQAIPVKDILEAYNQKIIDATKTGSFEIIQDLYDQESLLMTDYNPIIVHKDNIKIYYDTIFARKHIIIPKASQQSGDPISDSQS